MTTADTNTATNPAIVECFNAERSRSRARGPIGNSVSKRMAFMRSTPVSCFNKSPVKQL